MMRTRIIVLLALSLLAVEAAVAEKRSLAPPVASYTIRARLDADTRTVSATSTLRWKNTAAEPVSELCLHLYLNAFANDRTSFMEASPADTRRWELRHPGEWGGIDVLAARVDDREVTENLRFIRPDDPNRHDRTVALLTLPEAVLPSATTQVEMEFEARLPRVFARSGHAAPFFIVAQWFPKVGVLENGKWNCHQYEANGEFFADFGSYEVELTVPRDFVVGHTGVVREERDNRDGTRTLDIVAEDVHDFAWAADPRFVSVEEQSGDVRIVLLLQPHHRRQGERYMEALRAAMQRYAQWFDPYPYPQITLVDPGPGARGAAGMEYPMLFTAGTAWWVPRQVRLPEFVTVHEFGHQYWQGIVATDERNEPWLDEGINSFVEGRIMDETYGARASYLDLFGLRLNATAFQRLVYLGGEGFGPIARPGPRMLDRGSYQATAYAKMALALETLDRLLGGEKILPALANYYREWRFKHPSDADWRASMAKSIGENLDWYFSQVLDGDGWLDYAVARLDVDRERRMRGRGIESGELEAEEMKRYRNRIVFHRRGDVRVPVDLLVVFDDGSEKRASWDGQDRWYRLDITSTEKAAYAVIDPEEKLPLDVDRLNNSRMRSSGGRGIARLAVRWGLWLQGLLHVVTGV